MVSKISQKISQNKLLLIILLIAAITRFIGLMPNIPYPDEAHIQKYSWNIVKNIITENDFNPHTFKYGSLIFYLQAAVSGLVFIGAYLVQGEFNIPFAQFHQDAIYIYADLLTLVGRLTIAIFGVLSILLLFLIAKLLFNEKIGLLSALFLAVAPMHVRESHYMITDVFFIFTILLSLLCLIYLTKIGSIKWFILSGIAMGISATIRFFPIIFLVYPFALIHSYRKQKKGWFFKFFISLVSIFIGIFIGIPYLFLDSKVPELLLKDLALYALPWYGTNVSESLLSLVFSFIAPNTELPKSDLLYPAPEGFRPLHISWIFFNGLGPMPTLLSLIGVLILLRKSFKKFIFLFIIPFILFIYLSFFIPAIYEKLSLPILPFLAIFAGVAFFEVFNFFKKRFLKINPLIIFTLLLLILFLPQLLKSTQAGIACSKEDTQKQSSKWVDANFPDNLKIAYLPSITVPSTKNFDLYFQLEPKNNLSLEEARLKGADYTFINAGRLDYETYPYFNDFFVVPSEVYQNSYEYLVLNEYKSQSSLLNQISKPMMCDVARLYYYKLPKKMDQFQTPKKIEGFDFTSNQASSSSWRIQDYGYKNARINQESKIGKKSPGSLFYQQSFIKYAPPRIISPTIPIKGGKKYTFSFWVKAAQLKGEERIIGRIDFYNPKASFLKKIEGLLKEGSLLLRDGSTAYFFEKKMDINLNDNPKLPGQLTALSPRIWLQTDWQKVIVTAQAPKNTESMVLSIQNLTKDAAEFYIDDIELLTDN